MTSFNTNQHWMACTLQNICLFILLTSVHCKKVADFKCRNGTIFDERPFCVMEDYDKDEIPLVDGPMNITVITKLDDIIQVDDITKSVTIAMVLGISWFDDHLEMNPNSTAWHDDDIRYTFPAANIYDFLWKPATDVLNVKAFKTKQIFEPQDFSFVYEDHRLYYQVPIEVTLNCPLFSFDSYPFDTQTCELYIGNHQYTREAILYNGHLFYNTNNQRPLQYNVEEIVAMPFESGLHDLVNYAFSLNGTVTLWPMESSYFVVKMEFKRRFQPFLLRTYLPSFLLVFSSWIGFLIEPSSVPGRIALSVTLLLVLINMRYKGVLQQVDN